MSRWYKYTIGDVQKFQQELEAQMLTSQNEMEQQAKMETNPATVIEMITQYQETTAASVRDSWWQFFYRMVGKYRDIYIVENPHAESFSSAFRFMTYSRQALENMGFWGVPGTPPHDKTSPMPVTPINVPTYNTMAAYLQAYVPYPVPSVYYTGSENEGSTNTGDSTDSGSVSKKKNRDGEPIATNAPTLTPTVAPTGETVTMKSGMFYGSLVTGILAGIVVGATVTWWMQKKTDYLPLR